MRRWFGRLTVVAAVALAAIPNPAMAKAAGKSPNAGDLVAASLKAAPAVFDLEAELQGMYDEISQIEMPSIGDAAPSLIEVAIYAPGCAVRGIDGKNSGCLETPGGTGSGDPADWMVQRIQKLSVSPETATALVVKTTVRAVSDVQGRYGRAGLSHVISESTRYRDVWTNASGDWRLKSREQVGRSRVSVDQAEAGF